MNEEYFWNLLARKLSGEASEKEEAELESLLRSHPELSLPAQRLTNIWLLKKDGHAAETEEAFQKHWQKLKEAENGPAPDEERIRPGRKPWPAAAAALAVFLAAGTLFFIGRSSNREPKPLFQKAEVSTRPGARTTKLVLPDSSEVWLNAGSRLVYEPGFGVSNRNATLTGEAFFDVKRSGLPFVVHAGGVHVKVLGTAFNIKSYPNEPTTETSLLRGRVELTLDKRPGGPIVLKPNEKLIVANGGPDEKKKGGKPQAMVVLKELTHVNDSLVAETSWVENKLVFADEPLDEVARKMERWYNVTIDIKDAALLQLTVGGGPFENETIEQALSALQIAFGFRFTEKGKHITITR